MTTKLILPIILAAGICGTFASCNSEDTIIYEEEGSSSVQISSFSLQDDENVLDSLSNVFFAIDLDQAKIFNADSLPFGTDVSRLIPSISAPSEASAVTIEFPRVNMSDSIVDYLTTQTDSIDFSNGPVKIRVKSGSGLVERLYEVKVNVHQVKPDTLAWSSMAYKQAPTSFSSFDDISVVRMEDKFYSLTSSGSEYCLGISDTPEFNSVEYTTLSLSFTPVINSLRAAGASFYILDGDGNLYESADCANWSAAGSNWHYLYGKYSDQLIGVKEADGAYTIASYPNGKEWKLPNGFPVEGTSLPVEYTLPMAYAPQMILVGGITADGSLSAATWGFDGENWAKVSNRELPKALQGMAVVEYDLFRVPSSTWKPEEYPAILAFGGSNEDGFNREVYYSRDLGLTWAEAPDLLQLPEAVDPVVNASVLIYNYDLDVAKVEDYWNEIKVQSIPPFCSVVGPNGTALSRVTTPITNWDCPVIYMFGGTLSDGSINKKIWRAGILRYTFKPAY